jgi:hypothetical protein
VARHHKGGDTTAVERHREGGDTTAGFKRFVARHREVGDTTTGFKRLVEGHRTKGRLAMVGEVERRSLAERHGAAAVAMVYQRLEELEARRLAGPSTGLVATTGSAEPTRLHHECQEPLRGFKWRGRGRRPWVSKRFRRSTEFTEDSKLVPRSVVG